MAKGALPGFRDFYPEEFAERAHIQNAWRRVASRFAFAEYDGPPLEPLDLYTKKSGDEIVGQLYNFTDKGGREVALRPEMTPTFARMVGARANALRKPVRWFSVPQLFRYERQQKGRLREHFQLNVDIVGETNVAADAELLAVAIEIMRELGLTPHDVRARVSDRRLLRALLRCVGVTDEQASGVFTVVDKFDRQPEQISREKLAQLGLSDATVNEIVSLMGPVTPGGLIQRFGTDAEVQERCLELEAYEEYLRWLGVGDWVDLDLKIVRGLAYYTGIVFELFDAQGEFRAICGGGRYDTLLASLGGADLPALGFGMGDVVLGELLKARGKAVASKTAPDYWVAYGDSGPLLGIREAMRVATALRRAGSRVEYSLRDQPPLSHQLKAASASGAPHVVIVQSDNALRLKSLASGEERNVKLTDDGRLVDAG